MRVNYNVIIESYIRTNEDILQYSMDIATEAESSENIASGAQREAKSEIKQSDSTDTTDQDNQISPSPKVKQGIIQRIHKLIEKISDIIQQASIKIMNRLKLKLESDKSFFTTLNKRGSTTKPLQNFKAITYQYNEQYLESTMKGITNLCNQVITKLANPSMTSSNKDAESIAESDQGSIAASILRNYGTDKNRDTEYDITSFSREMIDTYRGEKKEQMWDESKIATLMVAAKSTQALANRCNQIINKCKTTLNEMKRMESNARTSNNSEELNKLVSSVAKATSVYNLLLSLTKMYHELKLESSLSARMLLKKFYQF